MILPPLAQKNRGFTLIELLVVISIIAVLIGLLFPVAGAVLNNSRKTEAAADESRIVVACRNFQTDYGKMPVGTANDGFETCYGDPGANSRYQSYLLFDVLRAIDEQNQPANNKDNQLNPRKVVYIESKDAKNPSDPHGGFLVKDFNDGNYTMKKGCFLDPWGDEYVTFINAGTDPDLNGLIAGYFYHDIKANQGPPGPVQVVSLGPDHDIGLKSNFTLKGADDVVTW